LTIAKPVIRVLISSPKNALPLSAAAPAARRAAFTRERSTALGSGRRDAGTSSAAAAAASAFFRGVRTFFASEDVAKKAAPIRALERHHALAASGTQRTANPPAIAAHDFLVGFVCMRS
jgi:hypothetical protein